MKKIAAIALLCSGAAAVAGADIQPYGPGQFIITTGSYSAGKAVKAATTHANAYCQQLGKTMVPVSTEEHPQHGPGIARKGGYSLVFRCDPATEAPSK